MNDVIKYVFDLTLKDNMINYIGWNPLHIACYYRRPEIIDFFLFLGFDPSLPIKYFKGKEAEYLPINLIELNQNLTNEEKGIFCDLLFSNNAFIKS